MVEKNTVGGKDFIGIPVIARHVIGVDLGRRVRALGLKGRRLALGGWRSAEHLTGGSLIKAGLYARLADSFQEADGPQAGNISRIFRHIEADPHMALGAQMIYLIGSDLLEEIGELPRNGEIAIMQIDPRFRVVEIAIEMIDSVGVEGAGPADEAVNFIAFAEEQLRQVGAVLARDTGDECFFHNRTLIFS